MGDGPQLRALLAAWDQLDDASREIVLRVAAGLARP
jgi:hypothetical protein